MLLNLKAQMNLKYQIHMFLPFLAHQELDTFALILLQAGVVAVSFNHKWII